MQVREYFEFCCTNLINKYNVILMHINSKEKWKSPARNAIWINWISIIETHRTQRVRFDSVSINMRKNIWCSFGWWGMASSQGITNCIRAEMKSSQFIVLIIYIKIYYNEICAVASLSNCGPNTTLRLTINVCMWQNI